MGREFFQCHHFFPYHKVKDKAARTSSSPLPTVTSGVMTGLRRMPAVLTSRRLHRQGAVVLA